MRTAPVICTGGSPCPGSPKRDFFRGKQGRFRGIRVGKKVFLTPDAALSERYVRWALKTLRKGETAAAAFQPRLRDLGASLDFLGQSDHKGDFIIIITIIIIIVVIIIIIIFYRVFFFFVKN